jgi:hypothetical protein
MEINAGAIYSYNRDMAQYNALALGDSLYILAGASNNRNVGIGTTAPAASLDTAGSIRISGTGYAPTGSGMEINAGAVYSYNRDTSQYNALALGDSLYIPSGVSNNRNVGIGTIAPAASLDTAGSIRISGTGYAPTGSGMEINAGAIYSYNRETSQYNALALGDSLYIPSGTSSNRSVGIGTTPNPLYKLDVNGSIRATSVINAVYQDLAEWVPASGDVPPGTVVILNSEKNNEVMPSAGAYDTRVAGVVSARPGLLLGEEGASKAKIATTGRVKVRVDAAKHPIHVGDLLVTSDISGTAMLSEPLDLGGVKIHRPGTLIGKALEPLGSGQGEILVLLSLQ